MNDQDLRYLPHSCGGMTMTCEACGAKLFPAEVGKKQKGGPAVMSSLCCGRGKVRLPRLPELPPVLMQRMFPDDPPALKDGSLEVLPTDSLLIRRRKAAKLRQLSRLQIWLRRRSRNFRTHARRYNTAFAMASTSGNVLKNRGGGVHAFTVQGNLFHRMGSLMNPPGKKPCFAQLYIMDAAEANRTRKERQTWLKQEAVVEIDQFMKDRNPIVQAFVTAKELFDAADPSEQPLEVDVVLRAGTDSDTFCDLPIVSEFKRDVRTLIPWN